MDWQSLPVRALVQPQIRVHRDCFASILRHVRLSPRLQSRCFLLPLLGRGGRMRPRTSLTCGKRLQIPIAGTFNSEVLPLCIALSKRHVAPHLLVVFTRVGGGRVFALSVRCLCARCAAPPVRPCGFSAAAVSVITNHTGFFNSRRGKKRQACHETKCCASGSTETRRTRRS